MSAVFHKVERLHFSGVVDKHTQDSMYQIIKIGTFLTELFKKY